MEKTFQETAIRLVFDYVKERLDKTGPHVTFGIDEVYLMWFSKVLLNWKALLSTTLPDDKRYEVTYDSSKNVAYIDVYGRCDNIMVSLGEDSTI